MKNRKKNLFKKCKKMDLHLSNHFFERWNERVSRLKFETKEELESYIRTNYSDRNVEHLWGNYYLIDGIMGGIYITAQGNGKTVLLTTTLGTYLDNPVIYNMITSGKINNIVKKYGKIDLMIAA
ncbi:hypothetical protein NE686_17345 [Tissierella carlieri]|uniref:Uncharacterized protein n=1 Tax=Tissierella carlieri TaxID=689904 RepID=A0ABT1SEJ3_9FIRM|nr:hypothetical protein [Tissierella carlieri]MCQ4924871.1 hypothetical protein [Tissierella carlieri]